MKIEWTNFSTWVVWGSGLTHPYFSGPSAPPGRPSAPPGPDQTGSLSGNSVSFVDECRLFLRGKIRQSCHLAFMSTGTCWACALERKKQTATSWKWHLTWRFSHFVTFYFWFCRSMQIKVWILFCFCQLAVSSFEGPIDFMSTSRLSSKKWSDTNSCETFQIFSRKKYFRVMFPRKIPTMKVKTISSSCSQKLGFLAF